VRLAINVALGADHGFVSLSDVNVMKIQDNARKRVLEYACARDSFVLLFTIASFVMCFPLLLLCASHLVLTYTDSLTRALLFLFVHVWTCVALTAVVCRVTPN